MASANTKVNVGIIGCGGIATTHMDAYLAFPDRCRLAALADTTAGKAAEKAEERGCDVRCFDDPIAAIQESDIDLVSLCTPPSTHADLAVAALEAGKHVLLEKPMASSLEECDRMLEAQRRSGKVLSVVAQNRWQTEVVRLKEVLASGKAGDILHAQVDSHWWRGHAYYDLWWRGTWASEGGGCTLNHAVHHFDLLLWLMGQPLEVRAVMTNAAHDNAEVEDLSVAILTYPEGRLAQVTASVVHHGEHQQLVFQGSRARISFPWHVVASTSRPNGFPERNEILEQELHADHDAVPGLAHELHEGQVDNVLSAILDGTPVWSDGVAGRNTLELITAIYKAATEDTAARLPIQPEDPWYTFLGKTERAPHFYEKSCSVESLGSDDIIVGSSSRQPGKG